MKKENKIKIVFKGKKEIAPKEAVSSSPQPIPEKKIQKQEIPKTNNAKPVIEPGKHERNKDIFKNKNWIYIVGAMIILLVLGVIIYSFLRTGEDSEVIEKVINEEKRGAPPLRSIPTNYHTEINIITQEISLSKLLNDMRIPGADAKKISKIGGKRSISELSIGDKIVSGFATEKDAIPEMIIIEPKSNPAVYYYLQLTAPLDIAKKGRAVEIVTKNAIGIIDSSLWLTILDNNIHYQLIDHLEAALAWSVDFYHLKAGDYFKVIYDEKFIDGKSQGIAALQAVYFRHAGEDIYAFNYEAAGKPRYYDQDGQEMKKAYLKSPLKYGRMSSPYSLDRKHPVTGVNKPHFGTDYAAPTGTPILSVADGTVIKREFKSNNGNYVKIRHSGPYESQYLHMSEFVPSVNLGTRVRQGQVIGYVGATGLATGPHVCFRFWKNGKQVDHRSERLPGQQQIARNELSAYTDYRTEMLDKLKNISWR
ncbi:MAG: murein DD-endopeptidase MepM/ murein hydrolase activator NlpD [Saprospiraceae bacterium]|jgi:murein DD-endopeptidase MepM/ murein hydrolase activator NlpD